MNGRRGGSVALIGLGTAIAPLDSAVNVAFPAITSGFALQLPDIQWLIVAYVLTYASLLLAMGRIGDLAGHRTVFRAGLSLSAAALVACALAPSYPLLLAARVAQGIGSALVLACGPALLMGLYAESDRVHAIGLYTIMFSLAAALGPLLGGALVARWGWPAVFWFRVPLALAALAMPPGAPPLPRRAVDGAGFDLAGAVLLALALAGSILAINRLGGMHGGDRGALVLPVATAAALLAFIHRERRLDQPLVDLGVFRIRGFAWISIGSVLINGASFAVLLLAPYFLVEVAHLSIPLSGALIALSGLGAAGGSPLAAVLGHRLHRRAVTMLGAFLCAAGLALAALAVSAAGLGLLAIGFAVQGAGLGIFQVAYMDFAAGALAPGARGVAGSIALLTRTIGLVLGASLLSVGYAAVEADALLATGDARAALVTAFRLSFTAVAAVAAAVGLLEALVFRSHRMLPKRT
jgi:MFS family permease